jgi:hypothetical protein
MSKLIKKNDVLLLLTPLAPTSCLDSTQSPAPSFVHHPHTQDSPPYKAIRMNPLFLPEIVVLIGAHLTRSETIACIRVCSLWHTILAPLLHHDFIFLTSKQNKTTRNNKRKQRKATLPTPQDYGYVCGGGALLIGRDNSNNNKSNKSNHLRRPFRSKHWNAAPIISAGCQLLVSSCLSTLPQPVALCRNGLLSATSTRGRFSLLL